MIVTVYNCLHYEQYTTEGALKAADKSYGGLNNNNW